MENLDSKHPQLLDESAMSNSYVGIKNLRFTILRDDKPQQSQSPPSKAQPKEHQWETPVSY